MKRRLLFLLTVVLSFVASVKAQKTVWDFGNGTSSVNDGAPTSAWPVTASGVGTIGVSTEAVIDKLGLFSNAASSSSTIANFGAVNASQATFSSEYTGENRFQANGAGYGGSTFTALPTQRYLYFTVDGGCTVKVYFKGGNTSSTRTTFITDGINTIGSAQSVNGAAVILNATITTAGKYYIYGDAANNYYKIEVSGANVITPDLSTKNFSKDSVASFYSNSNQLFVSNLKSETEVKVYSMTGALVKSAKTSSDVSFSLKTGVYIVKAKSAEGVKTSKVIVK